ncbi:EAL domain-containing protein [Roseospira navarrensis]|uniref:EAL domain-containing protein n=1 Tax=Roseospira navarrensis TaxID=140058 RepID=A0A7X1ZFE7_9PROT|nr:EAL domain-containing protein [Roseospira navarrensis]
MRCLVVDDEAFMRTLITRILGGLGARDVRACEDGQAALVVVGDGVDVVLCDLNMPGMDGIEFLRHLAGMNYDGAVVLISGEDERVLQTAKTLAQAHELRVLGAVAKPVTPAALGTLLKDATRPTTRRAGPRAPIDPVAVEELREAIASDQLTVFFQPKARVSDRVVVGVESLVRWRHPERGLVPPVAFVGVAEEAGLIDAMTDVVFRQAVAQGGRWRARGLDLKVAVNISVDSLGRYDLPDTLVGIAADAGLPPSQIMLEVTESRLMADIKSPLEVLTRLRMKGVGLSIDDFGTGHSSLEQLRRIPFTELKIDRAFVHGAARDKAARAILESNASLAQSLGMTTVAEGAEDQADVTLVAALGIDLIQGHFFAKPMPAEDFDDWLADWRG